MLLATRKFCGSPGRLSVDAWRRPNFDHFAGTKRGDAFTHADIADRGRIVALTISRTESRDTEVKRARRPAAVSRVLVVRRERDNRPAADRLRLALHERLARAADGKQHPRREYKPPHVDGDDT
jgi:hypothetical protein